MGPLIPFTRRREYQTHQAQAIWAFHSQAAFLFTLSPWVQAALANR